MTSQRWTRVLLVLLVQAVLVGVAVWGQLSARVTGREYALAVAPFDPMDPFRGAYVDLQYPDLPSLDDSALGRSDDDEVRAPESAYVPLVQQGDLWVGLPVVRQRPEQGPYLRCDDSSWRLSCGIESWFLPQSRARQVEAAVASGEAVAIIRVDRWGHAALLEVRIGDEGRDGTSAAGPGARSWAGTTSTR